ncbi:hypothetical protein KSP39_PZI004548 [Platanthera zijinensis]|uniref:Uncharacterized protein n=1 Tax=Platanthera zijinensis TaxID=2320716 RepID=A0AAP0GCD6_9ASPA
MYAKRAGKPLPQDLQDRLAAAQARALANCAAVAPWLSRKSPNAGPPEPKKKKGKRKAKVVRRDLACENRDPPSPTPNPAEGPSPQKESLPNDDAGSSPIPPPDLSAPPPEGRTRVSEEIPPAGTQVIEPASALPGFVTREDEARTGASISSAANPALAAGGVALEPFTTPKDADHPLGEDNPLHASGQAGTLVRKPFRPGRGKPLHLLYGTDGGVGPSHPTSVNGSRLTAAQTPIQKYRSTISSYRSGELQEWAADLGGTDTDLSINDDRSIRKQRGWRYSSEHKQIPASRSRRAMEFSPTEQIQTSEGIPATSSLQVNSLFDRSSPTEQRPEHWNLQMHKR